MKTHHQILHESFSEDFVKKMKNRIVMSHHKYGSLKEAKQDIRYPRNEIKNAMYRINKYMNTGNTEYLVDAANFLMFEFMEMHGNFIATDGDPTDRII